MKNRKTFIHSSTTRLLMIAAPFTMAFTIPGCPNVEEMNEKMASLEKKTADQQKALSELNSQLRTMNDEHNTMKQLVSQISTTVLEQKDALEKIDGSMREMASRKSAPTPAKSTGKKRR